MGTIIEGPQLSSLEREALALVAAVPRTREISESLDVGEDLVETLLGYAYAKLGVHGRAEAVATAHDLGLLEPARAASD